jgi:hypothetical protein
LESGIKLLCHELGVRLARPGSLDFCVDGRGPLAELVP